MIFLLLMGLTIYELHLLGPKHKHPALTAWQCLRNHLKTQVRVRLTQVSMLAAKNGNLADFVSGLLHFVSVCFALTT